MLDIKFKALSLGCDACRPIEIPDISEDLAVSPPAPKTGVAFASETYVSQGYTASWKSSVIFLSRSSAFQRYIRY